MKVKVQDDLRKLVFEMDDFVNMISGKIELLNDIETMFGQLRVSMDTAALNGNERLFYPEHHMKVRILSELMYHVMVELIEVQKKAKSIHLAIFDKVVEGSQKGGRKC